MLNIAILCAVSIYSLNVFKFYLKIAFQRWWWISGLIYSRFNHVLFHKWVNWVWTDATYNVGSAEIELTSLPYLLISTPFLDWPTSLSYDLWEGSYGRMESSKQVGRHEGKNWEAGLWYHLMTRFAPLLLVLCMDSGSPFPRCHLLCSCQCCWWRIV